MQELIDDQPTPPPRPAPPDPEDAATRVAVRPTPPPAMAELTDVISSPLVPVAPSSEADIAATRAKPAAAPLTPEASVVVAEGMGSTVILPDPGSLAKPAFGPAVGAPPPITAPGVTPSRVVSSSRPRAPVILGGMLIVLIAGSIGLWAASRHAATAPTPGEQEPSKVQPGTPGLPEADERLATADPRPPNDTQPTEALPAPTDPRPAEVEAPPNERPDTTASPPLPAAADRPSSSPAVVPSPGSLPNPRAADTPPGSRDHDRTSPAKRALASRDTTHRGPTSGPRPQEFQPGGEPTRPSEDGGTARLFVNTEPWSHVLVAGRDVGTTPVANVEVPAGRVSLTLIDPDGNRFRRTIRVSAGEQKRVFYQLDE